jgi:hypothetical protein
MTLEKTFFNKLPKEFMKRPHFLAILGISCLAYRVENGRREEAELLLQEKFEVTFSPQFAGSQFSRFLMEE